MGLLITDLATLIAPALLHGAHPRTQRLRIDPQLAANARGEVSDQEARIRALEAENRELRRANEILKAASAFFGAELDRLAR